jgi:hypothetical protein
MALMKHRASGFQWIITGDEPWFFLYYPRESSARRRVMSFPKAPNRNYRGKVLDFDPLVG